METHLVLSMFEEDVHSGSIVFYTLNKAMQINVM